MTVRHAAGILAIAMALSPITFNHARAQSKGKTGASAKSETSAKAPAPPLKPFDLNSAPEEDLVLAGIDRSAAKKIIAARPFKNKQELVSRNLLTKDEYEIVKELLVAKQPPMAPGMPST